MRNGWIDKMGGTWVLDICGLGVYEVILWRIDVNLIWI